MFLYAGVYCMQKKGDDEALETTSVALPIDALPVRNLSIAERNSLPRRLVHQNFAKLSDFQVDF